MTDFDTNSVRGRRIRELEDEARNLLHAQYEGLYCQHMEKESGAQIGNMLLYHGKIIGVVALRVRPELDLEMLRSPKFDNRIMLTKEKFDERYKVVASWMHTDVYGVFYLAKTEPRTLLFTPLFEVHEPLRHEGRFKKATMEMNKNVNTSETKMEDVYLIDMTPDTDIIQQRSAPTINTMRKAI